MRERLGELERARRPVGRRRRRRPARDGRLVASRRRCCGARSSATASTSSTRRTRRRSAGSPTRSTSDGRCSSSPRSRAATLETRSHFDFFWERGKRGDRFVVDHRPGLAARAAGAGARGRGVFAGEPTIGGRYSALSPFGLVPAALMGVDLGAAARPRRGDAERLPRRRRQPGPRARARARHALAGGPRQGRLQPNRERLRALGRAAARRVDRQGGQGARAGAGRVGPTAPTARRARSSSTTRTTSAPSSSAGSSRPRSRARSSRSTRSTSRTSRRRRTGRAQLLEPGRDVPVEPESSVEELLAQAQPGDYVAIQAFVDPAEEERAAAVRRAAARARPTASSPSGSGRATCTRPASCTRAARRSAASSRSSTTSASELPIPGQKFGFGRLIQAQAAGDYAALKERGRPVARIRLEEIA